VGDSSELQVDLKFAFDQWESSQPPQGVMLVIIELSHLGRWIIDDHNRISHSIDEKICLQSFGVLQSYFTAEIGFYIWP
jgi:hypothetical protein